MSRPILTIRPQPGCAATVAAAAEAGLEIGGWPLFEVFPVEWEAPHPDTFDALLLGSANALRHGGPALAVYRGKPVYAVGDATADAARAAGLEVASVGPGHLQALLDREPYLPPRLLRISGEEHVPVTAPEGVTIITRIAYATRPLPFPAAFARHLQEGALVLLHSAAAARHFAAECDRNGIARARIALAALGLRIAAAAGPGWQCVRSAEEPRDSALLALVADMCHEPGHAMN